MNGRKGYGKPRNMETGRRIGIVCMDMPETYGGAGLDFTFNALFIEEFAKKGIRSWFSLHSDIIAPYLLNYGTEAKSKNICH
jgi:alkylation response protein AidB-like acyl-CoA dehydrogenase